MLTNLHFKNFKSWPEADIKFGKITGLFGANSSGKSSILQFLLMLKQTKDAADPKLVLDFGGETRPPDLGGFQSIIHQHDENFPLLWSLTWKFPEEQWAKINDPEKENILLFEGRDIKQESEVRWKSEGLYPHHLAYVFSSRSFGYMPTSEKQDVYELKISPSPRNFFFKKHRGRPWPLPKPAKTHRFPDQVSTYFQNSDFLGLFESEYEECMDRIYYLGPLREYPKRQYVHIGSTPTDVGQRGQSSISAIIAATSKNEKCKLLGKRASQPFQKIIAHHLKEMGLIHSFRIAEIAPNSRIHQVLLHKNEGGTEVLLTDVGFGISQVLPVLVLLYYVPEHSTVLLEQPEIHLHPSVQSALADLMIEVTKTRNLQIIVESHSEHLLRRLQRKVAEAEIEASDVCLYFCDIKEGKSSLNDLKLNKYGEIENWPEDFFGNDFEEIAATQKAGLKKRMSNAE